MDPSDRVDRGDAAIQALLALAAEQTKDDNPRDRLLDAMVTVPPLAEWPNDALGKLLETARYIISLARLNRELEQLTRRDEE